MSLPAPPRVGPCRPRSPSGTPEEAPRGRGSLSFSSLGSDCAEEKAPAKGDGAAECAMRARKRKADVATVSECGPGGPPGCPRASAWPAAGLGLRALASFCWVAGGHAVAVVGVLGGRWSAAAAAAASLRDRPGACRGGRASLVPGFVLPKLCVPFCSSCRILMKKLPKWR